MLSASLRMTSASSWWRIRCLGAGVLYLFLLDKGVLAASPHFVFAHYMVCYATYGDFGSDTNSTIAGYKREIQEAQAAGIDGFALNVGAYNDPTQMYYNNRIAMIYEAAEQLGTGFKLFFSVDYFGESNIVNMVETYARRTNTFTYNGQVVLSAYGHNNVTSMGWPGVEWTNAVLGQLKKDGHPIYFVPFFFSDPVREIPEPWCGSEVASNYTTIMNGLFCFTAAGLPIQLAPANSNFISAVHGCGKLVMACMAPHYWGNVQTTLGRRYYETDGGEGLTMEWLSLIANQPDWVEICTWNDFNESTYISPVDNPETYESQLQTPHRYSHNGYLELSKRYITWFKSGQQPGITNDSVYYFYRSHPENLIAANTNDVPVTWRTGDIADQIYVTTVLTAPAQLEVMSGNLATTNPVPAGVNNFRAAFAPGAQIFVVSRHGTNVLTAQGPNILSQIQNYDFFPASGYSYGLSADVMSPPGGLHIVK